MSGNKKRVGESQNSESFGLSLPNSHSLRKFRPIPCFFTITSEFQNPFNPFPFSLQISVSLRIPMAMDLLKKDLKQVLYRIIQEEDFDSSAADDAIQILTSLKFSLMPAPSSQESPGCSGSKTLIIPDKFRCPISGDLMKDPVLLITGQVCDFSPHIICFLFNFVEPS